MTGGRVVGDPTTELGCDLLLLQGLHRWKWVLNRRGTGLPLSAWRRALAGLPPHHRAVVVLRFVWGWDWGKVAAYLGLGHGSVAWQRWHATARQLLATPGVERLLTG